MLKIDKHLICIAIVTNEMHSLTEEMFKLQTLFQQLIG